MGLQLSELLKKIASDIKSLDQIYDCDVYGAESLDNEVLKKMNIKVQGNQAQCFLSFASAGSPDRNCGRGDFLSIDGFFNITVFAKVDRTVDTKGYSTVGSDISQKILGFLHKNKFGFDNSIDNYPEIIEFSPVDDAIRDGSVYQIWQIAWTQKIKLDIT